MPIYAFVLAGIASFYDMRGSTMANGAAFNPAAHVCAMLYEPFGERVEIVNADNGKSSWCVVSDRGPFVPGRVIDISPAVRDELGFGGLASVRIYKVSGYIPKCRLFPRPQSCKTPPRECMLDLPKPAVLKCP
jgi:rare lipoprotein A